MNFTLLEKMAVLKAVDEVLMADGHIDIGEIAYLKQILDLFHVEMEFVNEARNLSSSHAGEILRNMDDIKKFALYKIMKEMATADGDFDPQELEVIFSILHIAGIKPS
ncbi:TerB family tellurite resistance protein [Soonwooa purpurea]